MIKILIVLLLFITLVSFYSPSNNENKKVIKKVAAIYQGSSCGCLKPPTISSAIPTDMALSTQQDANCFAWQEFIALNWQASPSTCSADSSVPASNFGEPNNTSPVVWEVYKEASEVFQPHAKAPTGWCGQQQIPPKFARMKTKLMKTSWKGYKFLSLVSKDAGNANIKLHDFQQADANGAWLTAQNTYITLYEIRMNEDEFNYINENKLYNADTQQTFVQNPGINLPDGTPQYSQYGNTGSIELKAAWIELDDSTQWQYFKTSKAYVVYPSKPDSVKFVTVGLVGLHIIHKTSKGQQFIWATFEHVNNAPSVTDISNKTLKPWYTFYSANCDSATDHYHCYPNAQPPSATACNPYFPNYPKDPYNAPMQVVRTTPISNTSTNNIQALNEYAWGVIAAANPNSVFLNYQLVNVLWPNNNTQIPPASTTPLTNGDIQPPPGTQIVANTTMETYFQGCNTCTSCHCYAPIATVSSNSLMKKKVINVLKLSSTKRAANSSPTYASDYSFLFSNAQSAKNSKK